MKLQIGDTVKIENQSGTFFVQINDVNKDFAFGERNGWKVTFYRDYTNGVKSFDYYAWKERYSVE